MGHSGGDYRLSDDWGSVYSSSAPIYRPSISYLFGAEYVYGSLERKNGFKWIAPRFVLSATYYLNKHPRE